MSPIKSSPIKSTENNTLERNILHQVLISKWVCYSLYFSKKKHISFNSFFFIGFSDKPIKVPKDVVNKPKEVSCPKPKSKVQETLISIINVINDIF